METKVFLLTLIISSCLIIADFVSQVSQHFTSYYLFLNTVSVLVPKVCDTDKGKDSLITCTMSYHLLFDFILNTAL